MFCPKCGKEIEGTPSICPLCNQDISGNLQVEENENPPVVKQGKNYAHLNKKIRHSMLTISQMNRLWIVGMCHLSRSYI